MTDVLYMKKVIFLEELEKISQGIISLPSSGLSERPSFETPDYMFWETKYPTFFISSLRIKRSRPIKAESPAE